MTFATSVQTHSPEIGRIRNSMISSILAAECDSTLNLGAQNLRTGICVRAGYILRQDARSSRMHTAWLPPLSPRWGRYKKCFPPLPAPTKGLSSRYLGNMWPRSGFKTGQSGGEFEVESGGSSDWKNRARWRRMESAIVRLHVLLTRWNRRRSTKGSSRRIASRSSGVAKTDSTALLMVKESGYVREVDPCVSVSEQVSEIGDLEGSPD